MARLTYINTEYSSVGSIHCLFIYLFIYQLTFFNITLTNNELIHVLISVTKTNHTSLTTHVSLILSTEPHIDSIKFHCNAKKKTL